MKRDDFEAAVDVELARQPPHHISSGGSNTNDASQARSAAAAADGCPSPPSSPPATTPRIALHRSVFVRCHIPIEYATNFQLT
jgi:hypothetical protein